MLIDVRPILHIPGKELNFQFELDLSDMEFGGRNPISRPVIVEGVVRNRAEVLYLELAAHTTLDAVCDRCGKCAEACPLGAIHADETEEIEICGKKMTVAVIDYDKCRVCKNGACPNRFTPKGKPDRVAALCNRTCLCHLEAEDRTENRFEQAFRKRDAWALNAAGSYAERNPDVANVLGGVFSKDGNRGAK